MKKSALSKIFSTVSSAVVIAAAMPINFAVNSLAANTPYEYGDANGDGKVSISDAVLVMQVVANADKFGVNGTDEHHITLEGMQAADVYNRGDMITSRDALSIQKYLVNSITSLPESWKESDDPVTSETLIHLKGSSIEVEGENAVVEGTTVTITHSGIYMIDGTLDDGQIHVAVPDETADPDTVKLMLNGVNITGKSAPAIYIENAENTSINLVSGGDAPNIISDGDTAYADEWLGTGVIEAKDDLTIKADSTVAGAALNITANTQDAIICKNDIKFTGGTTTITTLNSTDKTNAVNGKKSVTVKDNAVLYIDAEGDGLKSSKGNVSIKGGHTFIKAGNDAVQAGTTIDISGGVLTACGDRGLTADTGVNITGGEITATATDNQVDQTLLTASQNTLLFDCIADTTAKDGCWKKSNSFNFETDTTGLDAEAKSFRKKYQYVLLSTASLTDEKSVSFKNAATGSNITYGAANEAEFALTGGVSAFTDVDPSGTGETVSPSPTKDVFSITLNGASIKSDAPADTASVANSSLTISKPGTFNVTGDANDVQIVVDVDKESYPDGVVKLAFDSASLTNSTTAPIFVNSIGKEVKLSASGGDSVISDGTSHTQTYTDADGNINTVEGAVFARDDIQFNGTDGATLTINGNTDDAVICKNDIRFNSGNITINAVDDGVRGKDSVTIGKSGDTQTDSLTLNVKTQQGDGIKSTATDTADTKEYGVVTINCGTINITSYADGIQAEQSFVMNGGDLNIKTYQGSSFTGTSTGNTSSNPRGGGMQDGNSNNTDISAKGIKAVGIYDAAGTIWQSGGDITVNGGNITIDSSDDSLHCGGNMCILGGQFKLATADDALHSDHNLTLGAQNGEFGDFGIYASKCYEGVEGQNIRQYSGTVIVKADDDGYNAAGGADNSGNTNPGGWNPGGGFGSVGNNEISISGGIAVVQSASGDHDAFDSNGSINITGGITFANGQEPYDCDGTKNLKGNISLSASSQGSGSVAEGTQFTVADASDNVVLSFKTMRAMGSPSFLSGSGYSLFTGGTISGGTDLIALDDTQNVYSSGTISGGTAVTAGTGTGNQNPWNPRG